MTKKAKSGTTYALNDFLGKRIKNWLLFGAPWTKTFALEENFSVSYRNYILIRGKLECSIVWRQVGPVNKGQASVST